MAEERSAPPRPRAAPPGAGVFRVGSVLGFDFYVHWSWLIIFVLVAWSLESNYLLAAFPDWEPSQRWVVGFVTSFLFFASVLAHELAHALVARRRGTPVEHITLYIFGGASALGDEPRTARDEFWIAVVGPLTSFLTAGLFGALWLAARATDVRPVHAVAGYLAYINVAVGVFNLMPGFPLDGGRVLRSIAWGVKRNMLEATRIASNVGRVFAGLMIGGGILIIISGNFLNGFWLIFLGWFLWNAAESSYQQLLLQRSLHGLLIAPLIERDVPRVPPDLTLRQLAHDYILGQNQRAFFVSATDEGAILGLISLSDLRKAPQDQWDTVTVYRAMTPLDRLVIATPRTEAIEALEMMARSNINQLPVMQGREPLGLLTRAALINAIQLRGQFSAGA